MKEFVEPWKSLEAAGFRGRRVDWGDQATCDGRGGPCLLGLLGLLDHLEDLLELPGGRPGLPEAILGQDLRRGYC